MAALNGHFGTVQLLMDLGASVSDVTVEDGTTIDLIGDSDVTLFFLSSLFILFIIFGHSRLKLQELLLF